MAEPYQDRVVEEKQELDKKLIKLDTFNHSLQFTVLPVAERRLLLRQQTSMEDYGRILGERIEAF